MIWWEAIGVISGAYCTLCNVRMSSCMSRAIYGCVYRRYDLLAHEPPGRTFVRPSYALPSASGVYNNNNAGTKYGFEVKGLEATSGALDIG